MSSINSVTATTAPPAQLYPQRYSMGPPTVPVPAECFDPEGHRWIAVVLVTLGEPGDRHTPPTPHEADSLRAGSVRRQTGPRAPLILVGDLAVPAEVRRRLYGVALSRIPSPAAHRAAWERWHDDRTDELELFDAEAGAAGASDVGR